MFTNKHIIVALLVTPVLAILAWTAVGEIVGEKPGQAVPGQSYPMVERSNCRYDSGQCDLHNEDLQLNINFEQSVSGPVLLLSSNHSLDAALLGVTTDGETGVPHDMLRQDSTGLKWTLPLDDVPAPEQRLLVVVNSGGSHWFADTSTAFLARYRERSGDE